MALSIRWRLTLWNVLTLALGFLGFGGLVYVLLERALYQGIDRSLLTEMQELEHKPDVDLAYWIKEAKEHENILCVAYDANGQVYERTEEMPAESVDALSPTSKVEKQFTDMNLPVLGRYRELTSPVRLGDRWLYIVLLSSLEEVDRELNQFFGVLITAVPLALALAGGFGYFLTRKALAPMKTLHRLAAEITVDRLDRRLPVLNQGDELGQLTQTINAMVARLEKSVSEIRRFTADASHELRTPLTAIRTEAEVALRMPMSVADHQQLLGSILEECERLTRMTEQLLTLAREDAGVGQAGSQIIDINSLLDNAVETIRPVADGKGVSLRYEGKENNQVRGDSTRLRQVFINLLDNAIKFTPQGGGVVLRCEGENHDVRISVHDTGEGILEEHLSRVFDRFYRVDKARSREMGGTGLGLSIAQTIVNAHGGKIELESAPGQGTTCVVTLPAKGPL
jgi:heavy metal sensor kinase